MLDMSVYRSMGVGRASRVGGRVSVRKRLKKANGVWWGRSGGAVQEIEAKARLLHMLCACVIFRLAQNSGPGQAPPIITVSFINYDTNLNSETHALYLSSPK